MKLSTSLDKNLKILKKEFTSFDVIFHDITLKNGKGVLIFIDSLTDKMLLSKTVLSPLSNQSITDEKKVEKLLLNAELKKVKELLEGIDTITNGNALLIIDGLTTAFSVGAKRIEKRAITEPPTSVVLKGPREGFVEDITCNLSLLRRRLKTPKFQIENLSIGKQSKTTVCICYIKGIVKKGLPKKIREKLKSFEIDAILDSSYITRLISEHSHALFKQIGTTEKPDVLVSKLLEGRLAIIVDGSPMALTLPYMLLEDFQSPEDYYTSVYKTNFARLIRVISVFLSLALPSFYVSAQLFHLQLIPLPFLLTIVNSIKGIPLSPSLEMFFTLLIFEILNESSLRMPKYVGMVVSIVGGLVLGETAVNAGIISAPALMIIALSGICLYTVPDLLQTFSILRFLFLVIAGTLGGYGLVLGLASLLIYMVSFETFETPLLAPFSPLVKKDLKDSFYKETLISLNKRPTVLKSKNKTRLKIKEKLNEKRTDR
ncbi:MAG: spore germination protein [Clostridiales bacterium]|nr:spore germination protein [Clostridiales bacterium]